MRALICGGRNFGRVPLKDNGQIDRAHPAYERRKAQYTFMRKVFLLVLCEDSVGEEANETWLPPRDLVIIHGGATGADTCADEWAVTNWLSFEEYKADWDSYGKRAGMIRNKKMLREGKPDLVLAFPGGSGTANMVSLARAAGVTVMEFPYHDSI